MLDRRIMNKCPGLISELERSPGKYGHCGAHGGAWEVLRRNRNRVRMCADMHGDVRRCVDVHGDAQRSAEMRGDVDGGRRLADGFAGI